MLPQKNFPLRHLLSQHVDCGILYFKIRERPIIGHQLNLPPISTTCAAQVLVNEMIRKFRFENSRAFHRKSQNME